VACRTRSGKTSLTEAQARALADWWGGKYHQAISPECPEHTRHGVIIATRGSQDLANPTSGQKAVFFLEEAKIIEKGRGHDNPGATDWVG